MCICRSITWTARRRGWERINFNYKTGVVNEYFMCNSYCSYLFPPQTDELMTKCCRLTRLVSAELLEQVRRHQQTSRAYVGRQKAETLPEYQQNNSKSACLFGKSIISSHFLVSWISCWHSVSCFVAAGCRRDTYSSARKDIVAVYELQLHRSEQCGDKIPSCPFVLKRDRHGNRNQGQRDREK